MLKVQMDAFIHNISSPSYFAVLTEGQAVTRASAFFLFFLTVEAIYCIPRLWHELIRTVCPPAMDLILHKGMCIYFTSSRGQTH